MIKNGKLEEKKSPAEDTGKPSKHITKNAAAVSDKAKKVKTERDLKIPL